MTQKLNELHLNNSQFDDAYTAKQRSICVALSREQYFFPSEYLVLISPIKLSGGRADRNVCLVATCTRTGKNNGTGRSLIAETGSPNAPERRLDLRGGPHGALKPTAAMRNDRRERLPEFSYQ